MASRNTLGRQGNSLEWAVLFDGILCVARACGVKPAGPWGMRRDNFSIKPDEAEKKSF
jgi:hypothetical protein